MCFAVVDDEIAPQPNFAARGAITLAPLAASNSTACRFTFSNITLPMHPANIATFDCGLVVTFDLVFSGNRAGHSFPSSGNISSIFRSFVGKTLNRPIFRSKPYNPIFCMIRAGSRANFSRVG